MDDSTTLLIQLQEELQHYKKALGEAQDTIINQNVSNYPIMVVHKQEVEIGIPLIQQSEQLIWSINASTLEEFVAKKIVEPHKVEGFKEVYKSTEEFICLFVLSELGATFIFLSRN